MAGDRDDPRVPEFGRDWLVDDATNDEGGIPAVDEDGTLRGAAMWVVLNWDGQRTQHVSMRDLREALGLPRDPPTREEAERRINEYIGLTA